MTLNVLRLKKKERKKERPQNMRSFYDKNHDCCDKNVQPDQPIIDEPISHIVSSHNSSDDFRKLKNLRAINVCLASQL